MLKNNLKRYRTLLMKKESGESLTKTEMANIVNVSIQQYLRYENGGTVPSLEVGMKIAQHLRQKSTKDNIELLREVRVDDIWYIVPGDGE